MGPELAEADVDHVVFTGSAAVGRKLAARLGERLISSTLELSGCDAAFVLADADVDLAARAAWFGATLNRGQTCIAVRRVFVPSLAATPRSAIGCVRWSRPAGRCGWRLPAQARQAERLVDEAVGAGRRRLLRGSPGRATASALCRPVVVVDARPEMALPRGAVRPGAGGLPFDDARRGAGDGAAVPLRAGGVGVHARDAGRRSGWRRGCAPGMVTVNDVIVPTAHPATPFGGRGESGWGVTQGAEGLLEMTVPQVGQRRAAALPPPLRPG